MTSTGSTKLRPADFGSTSTCVLETMSQLGTGTVEGSLGALAGWYRPETQGDAVENMQKVSGLRCCLGGLVGGVCGGKGEWKYERNNRWPKPYYLVAGFNPSQKY